MFAKLELEPKLCDLGSNVHSSLQIFSNNLVVMVVPPSSS